MTAPRGEVLYSPELLALAVSLADWPVTDALPLRGEARSRSCGSTLTFAAAPDGQGRIAALGLQVSACAVGQAAAAVFAQSASGRSADEIAASFEEIERWLADGGDLPAWPGFVPLASARAYPGRHAAMLLPWKAALAALCKVPARR